MTVETKNEKRPKWTRAFAPKVRTGCITWIRRKKCDEEKPVCRRCREGKYQCEGYGPRISSSEEAKSSTSAVRKHPKKAQIVPGILDRATTSPLCIRSMHSLLGDAAEMRFFRHFFTCTVADMDMVYLPGTEDFWKSALPPLAQDVPFLRHAVIALGASHQLFLSRAVASPEHVAELEGLLLSHYNKAILSVTPVMASPSYMDVRLILICCLLFVCLDTLRGAQTEALRHLEAGARLIAEHAALEQGHLESLTQEIATLFCTVGADVTMFMEDRLLPDLTPYAKPPKGNGDISQPFPNFRDAVKALVELDIPFSQIWWDCDSSCDGSDSSKPSSPDAGCPWDSPAWKRLRVCFEEWKSRFMLTKESLQFECISQHEKSLLLHLELDMVMWELTFDEDVEWNLDPARCSEILDQFEQLQSASPATHPIFTLRAGMVAALIFVYTLCSDVDRRRRVISMLRSQQRREIVWDSQEVADFLEKDLEGRLKGIVDKSEWLNIGPSLHQGSLLTFHART